MRRRSFLGMFPGALAMAAPQTLESVRDTPLPNRPKVSGTLALRARGRSEEPPGRVEYPNGYCAGNRLRQPSSSATCGTLTPVAYQRNGWQPWRPE